MQYSFLIPDGMTFHMSFPNDAVHGHGVTTITVLTQAEYDALEHPDERTLYIISAVATPPESE